MRMKNRVITCLTIICSIAFIHSGYAQESLKEEDFFRIARVSMPEGVLLEVGGLKVLPNGDLGISTRRGDVYIAENPTSPRPFFRKFASDFMRFLDWNIRTAPSIAPSAESLLN